MSEQQQRQGIVNRLQTGLASMLKSQIPGTDTEQEREKRRASDDDKARYAALMSSKGGFSSLDDIVSGIRKLNARIEQTAQRVQEKEKDVEHADG